MFVNKKGEIFKYTFNLSSDENPLGKNPTVMIQNLDTGMYFSGFSWAPNASLINLELTGPGVCEFTMHFPKEGKYRATFFDPSTDQKNIADIEVVADQYAEIDRPYTIPAYLAIGHNATVTIKRISDGFYWDGDEWKITSTALPMDPDSDGMGMTNSYLFTYSEKETFKMEITDTTEVNPVQKQTVVFLEGPFEQPQRNMIDGAMLLSDKSLIFYDNGVKVDSVIKNEKGEPVADAVVKIIAVRYIDHLPVPISYNETRTDKNGRWRITLGGPDVEDFDGDFGPFTINLFIEKEGHFSLLSALEFEDFEIIDPLFGPM